MTKEKQVLLSLLWSWAVEDFADLGNTLPKKSHHLSGPSPMRPSKRWTCPDTKMLEPLVVNGDRYWVCSKKKRRGLV